MNHKQLEQLQHKKQALASAGGEAAIGSQHQKGKMTARERLEYLFDQGSFVELGAFAAHSCTDFDMDKTEVPYDAVVTGFGKINGRKVCAFAQDFTIQGGSLGLMHAQKILTIMDFALKTGTPVVGLNDSGGARIQEGVDSMSGYGRIFRQNTLASGIIPQISAIMGPCAGGASYSPALTDFVLMVDSTSQMFLTGPKVIKAVTGEVVTSDELGGSISHNMKSGVAQLHFKDDRECLDAIKILLSYLPQNNREQAPVIPPVDRVLARPALQDVLPEKSTIPYDMKRIIQEIADDGVFFEISPLYAQNLITGFARIDGNVIGIVASQPKYLAGCLDINASDKGSRFIRICDAYNIPLLNLVDVPGFLPSIAQEWGGVIRHGAKMLYAYSEATVPKVTLIIRKAYGGAYLGMCSKDLGADIVLAWPSAEIAVMGPEGAANIIFRKEIEASETKDELLRQRIEEYRETFMNPYVAAARNYVDDVIFPSETKSILVRCFDSLKDKVSTQPLRKHGIMPV
jgi:acetyl-CoA carboxylase carboxyltransferase component